MNNESDPDDAEKQSRDLADGLQTFEALLTKVNEHAGRYLVIVNGGGIMVCLGVVTTLVSNGKPVIQVLPGALFFVIGLALCGKWLLSMGMRLSDEVQKSFVDVGHFSRNEMTYSHVVLAALHRRNAIGKNPGIAFFPMSFISFISGSMALLIGLAWQDLAALIICLWD
ncbi:hypothetical protein BEN30_01970 [Magnetovibrio blakemorei]|uniref:Uncharacterized protein n=2 Tax=Magnetovibrio blakemorei TaxID=28181 RepID=A0A1E5QC17_9PROT|nr:hypothetical protein BEN30_01970 [Magnetovibrio blakemorei]